MKTFIINGRTLDCEIKRSRRKTVALYVFPDNRVEIRVPLFYNINNVEPFLIKHSRWLFKRLDSKNDNVITQKRFVDGELHYFLGKQYPININISSKNSIVFQDNVIRISMKSPDLVESLLDRWYLEQAKRVFQEIAMPLMKQMEKYNVGQRTKSLHEGCHWCPPSSGAYGPSPAPPRPPTLSHVVASSPFIQTGNSSFLQLLLLPKSTTHCV